MTRSDEVARRELLMKQNDVMFTDAVEEIR
jgi:hypothetical protein